MLQAELCRHSAVQHVAYSPHTHFETHHWLKSAVVLQRPEALYLGGRTYQGYGGRGNARTYLVDLIKGNVPDYVPSDDDNTLVFGGWEALCGRYAAPVFFEKSPQILAHWAALSLLLEWIGRTGMDVKVIGLVRNPLAVQYSARELFSTEPERRQYDWLRAYRNLLAFRAMLPAASFRLIRYEDIIAQPREEFSGICDFLGIAPEPLGKAVHATSLEKWLADPNYTLQLDPAVVQVARRLGYADADLLNPRKPSAATRRTARVAAKRRARLWLTRMRDRVVRPAYFRLRDGMRGQG